MTWPAVVPMALADLRALARAAGSVSHVSHCLPCVGDSDGSQIYQQNQMLRWDVSHVSRVSHKKHDSDEVETSPPTLEQTADEAADRAAIAGAGEAKPAPEQSTEALEALVNRLAAAMARKPGQRITDPERAARYFQGEARRRLLVTDDPVVRGLLVSSFEAARGFNGACQRERGDD